MIEEVAFLAQDQGRSMTLRHVTKGAYSTSTSAATVTTTTETVKGFLLDYKERERDGTQVKAGDRKAIISAQNITTAPKTGDVLVADGSDLQIVNVRKIEQSGAAIAFVCQVRR